MSAERHGVYDEVFPPHASVAAWVERLQPIVGGWISSEDIALVVDELFYLVSRDLHEGRDVDLKVGRLVCDGEEVEWVPAE